MATMYRLYRDWMNTRNEKTVASESHYRHVFNYSHNLRFHIPKKDQCDICTHYEFSTGLNKDNAEEEYRRHKKNKTIVRKLKEDDKKKHLTISLCASPLSIFKKCYPHRKQKHQYCFTAANFLCIILLYLISAREQDSATYGRKVLQNEERTRFLVAYGNS